MNSNLLPKSLIVTTTQLTLILISVATVFVILIIFAILKMYKLKAENKKLMQTNAFKDYENSEDETPSGHLYGES